VLFPTNIIYTPQVDVKRYVKIEKIPGGELSDCKVRVCYVCCLLLFFWRCLAYTFLFL